MWNTISGWRIAKSVESALLENPTSGNKHMQQALLMGNLESIRTRATTALQNLHDQNWSDLEDDMSVIDSIVGDFHSYYGL